MDFSGCSSPQLWEFQVYYLTTPDGRGKGRRFSEQAERPAAGDIDSLVNTPLLSMEDILKVRRLCIIFGSSLVN